MGRNSTYKPLRIYLNARFVGELMKAKSGAISFQYDRSWIELEGSFPISLSLPLQNEPYKGEKVIAVFENLLPDAENIRKRIAGKVGAKGIDAFSMLSKIGKDCIGALQFIPSDASRDKSPTLSGDILNDLDVEYLLKNLSQAPLGLEKDDNFRISVAGAQEKTALLRYKKKWIKPYGTTPTTHIFKTQIGVLQNGLDLSNSVENEYYCLKLAEAFGLPVCKAEIIKFGHTKALVIERFDRQWIGGDKLLRLPQEDFCQALSIPPTLKYQNEGGPGISQILD